MQRRFRLSRSEDFKRVRLHGKSYAHPLVVLVAQASEASQIHVGVAAGKTTGTAVRRNRAKRLLREAIRPMLLSMPGGWDLVLIARPALVSATLSDAQLALRSLLQRAKILPADES